MIRAFNAYSKVLAVSPGLECSGWAIFSDESGRLLECGIAEPFAVVNPAQALDEMRAKLQQMWEKRVGFSKNPELLVVETHRLETSRDTSIYTFLAGVLREMFSAMSTYLPPPAQQGLKGILELNLDKHGVYVLRHALTGLSPRQQEAIRRAVTLGLWGYNKWAPAQELAVIKRKESNYA